MWLVVALLLNSSLVVMAGATISPCLPEMRDAFRGSPGAEILVPLVLTIPALVIAVSAPAAGYLVDTMGRRPLLVAGLLTYVFSGSSGLWLDSLVSILVGRACLGAAVALIMTATTALIGDHFEGHERRRLIGMQAASMSFSGVLFVLSGGFLADLHWRAPFWVYVAAIPVLLLSLLAVREPSATFRCRVSPLIAGYVSIPWLSTAVVYILAVLGMAIFYLIPVQLPFYLNGLTGGSPWKTGVAISAATLTGSVVSLYYPKVRSKLGFEEITGFLFTIVGAGYVLLSFMESLSGVLPSLVVSGIGLGMLLPNLTLWITELAPDQARGRLVGGLTSFIFLGQFLSPILIRPFVDRWGYGGLWGAFGAGGLLSFSIGVGFSLWSGFSRYRARS